MLKRAFAAISILTVLSLVAIGSILIYAEFFMPCPHPSFAKEITPPTCSAMGYTTNKCNRCSFQYTTDFTNTTSHALEEITMGPTCSKQGYTLKYCSCGYSITDNYTPITDHDMHEEIIPPTCSEQGYTLNQCQNCTYCTKSNFVEPVGHSFRSETFLPTSVSAGFTQYTCECSYSYAENYVYYNDILESAYTENTKILQKGLDVSRWNHQIDERNGEYLPLDWKKIKEEGFDFVILKAGSTKSGIEPTFEQDYTDAKAAGLEVGAYFYTYSQTVEGILKDAKMLMLWLENKQFEYPIYLDLEDSSLEGLGKSQLSEMCIAFLCTLQENGYYVGLYTNHTWLTTLLDGTKMLSLFDIWYARYPRTEVPVWDEEKYGKQLGMWQYTESGRIDGIEGEFDFNYSYKDYTSIIKKWKLNGYK